MLISYKRDNDNNKYILKVTANNNLLILYFRKDIGSNVLNQNTIISFDFC